MELKSRISVLDQIQNAYNERIRPLEAEYAQFYGGELENLNLAHKPMILVLGMESTGKTSFIEQHFSQKISPDEKSFTIFMDVQEEKDVRIEDESSCADTTSEFSQVAHISSEFLQQIKFSQLNSELLQNISIVDTPGISNFDETTRNYYKQIVKWFAQKSDRIFLLFDPFRVSISKEYSQIIQNLKAHERKFRIILTKIDLLDKNEVKWVQGKLLWNLARIMTCTETPIIFNWSSKEKFLHEPYLETVQQDTEILTNDLKFPAECLAKRKLIQISKRAELALIYGIILGYLRSQMPMMGVLAYPRAVKKFLVRNLRDLYKIICVEHKLNWENLPEIDRLQEMLKPFDFYTFPRLGEDLLRNAKDFMQNDLPRLHRLVEEEEKKEIEIKMEKKIGANI